MVSTQQSTNEGKIVKRVKNLAREYALDFTSGKTHVNTLANGNGNGNGNGHALIDEEEESLSRPRGFFADQFEVCIGNFALAMTNVDIFPQNRSNFAAHFTGTGPEIWRQTNGEVAAFVAGAGWYIAAPLLGGHLMLLLCVGTGGTIAGTGQFLKSIADDVLVVLADPEGSGLYNKVQI